MASDSDKDKTCLRPAQIAYASRPDHVEPCDGVYLHGAHDLVDMCIEVDLLAYAPVNTKVCHSPSLLCQLMC